MLMVIPVTRYYENREDHEDEARNDELPPPLHQQTWQSLQDPIQLFFGRLGQ